MSQSPPDPAITFEVTPRDVAAWLALPADQRPRLIDCREQEEWDLVKIDGAELIPLGETPSRLEDLSASPHGLVIYCHHGVRSMRVTQFLRGHGLENTFSMAGGIHAWANDIEPHMARY